MTLEKHTWMGTVTIGQPEGKLDTSLLSSPGELKNWVWCSNWLPEPKKLAWETESRLKFLLSLPQHAVDMDVFPHFNKPAVWHDLNMVALVWTHAHARRRSWLSTPWAPVLTWRFRMSLLEKQNGNKWGWSMSSCGPQNYSLLSMLGISADILLS